MEHNKKDKGGEGKVGAFLSGVAVATAIGGYFFFGSKNAKKNRQKTEDWIEEAKATVVAKVKKVKKLSKEKYEEIVDGVSDQYAKLKEIGKEKADELRAELKAKWQEIEAASREDEEDK